MIVYRHEIDQHCRSSGRFEGRFTRFYSAHGDPALLKRNIERMMESVNAFLELDRLRNTAMSEYLLKTGWVGSTPGEVG